MAYSESRGEYEKKANDIRTIQYYSGLWSSISMLLVDIAFVMYLLKNKRGQKFELTIIVCMALKYAILVFFYIFKDKVDSDALMQVFVHSSHLSLGFIVQWQYVS